MKGFYQKGESHKFTRNRCNNNTGEFDQKSVVDYFIISFKRIVKDMKVLSGNSLDSDHMLLVAEIEIKAEKVQMKEKEE